MNKQEKIRELINKRERINDNDLFLVEFWKKMAEFCVENLTDTIEFIQICTQEEFVVISEICDDIIEKTNSKEFCDALLKRLSNIDKVIKEKYNLEVVLNESITLLH